MRFLKKIPIHFSFYLLAIWFIVCGQFVEFLTFISVLFIHEFGHYIVSKKCGYTLDKFYIAPYGACLNYKEKQFEKSDEIKIALAGPLSNLITAFVFISLWWIFPQIYAYSYLFVEESIMLAVFNLLPAYPLDGGRVLVALSSNKIGRNKAVKRIKIVNFILSILFFVLFVISFFYSFNPTLALAVIFLLSGIWQDEYNATYKNSFLFRKRISNFSKPKTLLVNSEMCFNDLLKKIDGNCYTIFQVVSKRGELIFLTEQQIIDYCVKFDGKEKLSLLFN